MLPRLCENEFSCCESRYNKFDEREGSKEEPVYERVRLSQWSSEYFKLSEDKVTAEKIVSLTTDIH